MQCLTETGQFGDVSWARCRSSGLRCFSRGRTICSMKPASRSARVLVQAEVTRLDAEAGETGRLRATARASSS